MNANSLIAVGLAGTVAGLALGRRATRRISLRGRVVLITGGSRGLGLVLARELARVGARIAICARDAEELARAVELAGFEEDYLTVQCDVTEPDQVADMVERVERELGAIDVLINNAGVIEVGPLESMTREDYEQAMRVHFWGPRDTTERVLEGMRARRFGRIVNISSVGGRISVPHLSPYCASKFALTGYSRGLRAELARHGILVTTVCPGLMRTGSPSEAHFKGNRRAEYAWFSGLSSTPLLSMSDRRAARQILRAVRYGDPELVVGRAFDLAVRLHDLFPATSARLFELATLMLPSNGGPEEGIRGAELAAPPAWLTWLTRRAARRNNEAPMEEAAETGEPASQAHH